MAQCPRALTVLPEVPGLIPTTYTHAHNHLKLQFSGIWYPLRASTAPDMHMVHRHTCRQNIHIYKRNLKKITVGEASNKKNKLLRVVGFMWQASVGFDLLWGFFLQFELSDVRNKLIIKLNNRILFCAIWPRKILKIKMPKNVKVW